MEANKVLFRSIEEALNQLRAEGGHLTYHTACISHPWRVLPDSWGKTI